MTSYKILFKHEHSCYIWSELLSLCCFVLLLLEQRGRWMPFPRFWMNVYNLSLKDKNCWFVNWDYLPEQNIIPLRLITFTDLFSITVPFDTSKAISYCKETVYTVIIIVLINQFSSRDYCVSITQTAICHTKSNSKINAARWIIWIEIICQSKIL